MLPWYVGEFIVTTGFSTHHTMQQILLRADVQGISQELDALISIKKIVPEESDAAEEETKKTADEEESEETTDEQDSDEKPAGEHESVKKTADDKILEMGAASVSYTVKAMREELEYDPDDPYGE